MIGSGFIEAMLAAAARLAFLRRRRQIGPGEKSTRYRTGGKYPGHVLRKLRAERGVGRPPAEWHEQVRHAAE